MGRPSACTVYLIRHGETDWNRSGIWQGHAQVPLNAAGQQQAMRLARRLADEGVRFDALYSSDLSRAWETAAVLGGALGLSPVAAAALREIDLGAWSGKTRAQITLEFPEEWRRIQNNEDLPRGGGETVAACTQRVMAWMDRTAERHTGRTICAVTHGGCIRNALLHALDLTWAERNRIPSLDNASITVMQRGTGGWRAVRMNDVEGIHSAGGEEGWPEDKKG
ncbi:MAG: histidine phosphatase family protein [Anaerolineales bacterium]